MPEENEPQTPVQKKILFANSPHVEAAISILQGCSGVSKLVAETEYGTIVNAVTLDAQNDMIKSFIDKIDAIRNGSLLNAQNQ